MAIAICSTACVYGRVDPPALAPRAKPKATNTPAQGVPQYRLVPLTDETRAIDGFGDDGLRLIAGVRIRERFLGIDSSDTVGAATLEAGRSLPQQAGGGFLFWSERGLYRAPTFLGGLQPLTAKSAVLRVSVGPGFWVAHSIDGRRQFFDGKTFRPIAQPLPGLVDVAAAGDGRVVAALEFGRYTVSLDDNVSTREVQQELGGQVERLSEEPLGFMLEGGVLVGLNAQGKLTRSVSVPPADPRWVLSEPPLAVAVSSGVLHGPGRARVAASAALAEVDLGTGQLRALGPQLLPGRPDCKLFEHGAELLMRCQAELTETVLSGLDGATPHVEQSFGKGVSLLTDFGQVFANLTCQGRSEPLHICVREAGGVWKDLAARATLGRFRDVVGYAVKAAGGFVAFVDDNQFPNADINNQGYIDFATGVFTSFPGVRELRRVLGYFDCRVDQAGGVRCLTPSGPLAFDPGGTRIKTPFTFSSLSSAGRHVLAGDQKGALFQSDDWGETWAQVLAPPVAGEVTRCSAVGCRINDWLRLGWQARPPELIRPPRAVPAAAPAPEPRPELRCESRADLRTWKSGLSRRAMRIHPPPPRRFNASITATAHDDDDGLHGMRGTVSGYQLTQEGDAPPTVPLVFSFLEHFDVGARRRHASLSPADMLRAARGAEAPLPTSEDPRQVVPIPVLGREAGTTAGFVTQLDGVAAWVRNDRARALPLGPASNVVSAVASGEQVFVLLEGGAVLKASSRGATRLFQVPPNMSSVSVRDADALGIGPDGELAVLRFGGLARAPSVAEPAWAYRPGKPPLALAPWSSLRGQDHAECQGHDGFRAIVIGHESWLELGHPGDGSARDDWGMIAELRWSTERICIEAVELGDDSYIVDDEALMTRVVARFGAKPAAVRLGWSNGLELRQTLSCELAAPKRTAFGPKMSKQSRNVGSPAK